MGPADERLEADDAVGVQVEDRLVVGEQVAVADRRPQLALLLNPRQHRGVHLLAVGLEAVLAALLRLVHGDVGVPQQLLARDARLVEGDADAAGGGGRAGLARDVEVQGLEDAPGHLGDVVLGPDILNEHGELVASEPGRRVEGPQAFGEVRRHPLQQLVSFAVAQAVVHRLEVVEVDEQHG